MVTSLRARAAAKQEQLPLTTNDDLSKARRHRRRHVSTRPILIGGLISVGLLVFISMFDFQKPAQRLLKSKPTLDGRFCQVDGHCPLRSTCSVLPNTYGVGTCLPFITHQRGPPASQYCADACLKELQKDEHFYHGAWPVVEWTEVVTGSSRPEGCLIVYRRKIPDVGHWSSLAEQDKQPSTHGIENSIWQWVHERFRHIKRVDPYNDDSNDDRWVAFCTQPCAYSSDCATLDDGATPGFICQEGACLRNPNYFTNKPEMVLVTAASGGYYRGLLNLAASARHFTDLKMIVYNLGGMSDEQKQAIRSWSNVLSLEWPDGVPSRYPAHVHEGKKYAWKPIIVKEAVERYGSIFWLDSGSTLTGKVDMAKQIVEQQGIMLVKGQDLDMIKSHELSYKWLGVDKATLSTGPHFSGNTQAFMYPSRYYQTVIEPNAKCASEEGCIAPPGSNLANHRYDQTTISILAYHPKVKLPHYTEILAAERNQLKEDLSEPNFRFVWTARQSCSFYAQLDKESKSESFGRLSHREDIKVVKHHMKVHNQTYHDHQEMPALLWTTPTH